MSTKVGNLVPTLRPQSPGVPNGGLAESLFSTLTQVKFTIIESGIKILLWKRNAKLNSANTNYHVSFNFHT